MEASVPNWFRADELFSVDGKWFFGSDDALNIGPYNDREVAQTKGLEVAAALRELKSDNDRMRFVQRVLQEEWKSVGATSHDGSAELIELAAPPEPVRAGESNKRWYRAERFFQVDGVWFFSTREGIDVGPFDSEMTAKKHERRLISLLIRARSSEEAYRVIHEYKHRSALEASEYATPQYVPLRR